MNTTKIKFPACDGREVFETFAETVPADGWYELADKFGTYATVYAYKGGVYTIDFRTYHNADDAVTLRAGDIDLRDEVWAAVRETVIQAGIIDMSF